MCVKYSGCNYWTFTVINGKTTCFLKGNYSKTMHDTPSDMHISGQVMK